MSQCLSILLNGIMKQNTAPIKWSDLKPEVIIVTKLCVFFQYYTEKRQKFIKMPCIFKTEPHFYSTVSAVSLFIKNDL